MSEPKIKYTIEFVYADNGQIYQNDVELTESERARIETYLIALEDAGHIEIPESSLPFVYTYTPPDPFINFETLQANWKNGSLLDWGRDLGVTL